MNTELESCGILDALPRYDHVVRHSDGSVGIVEERLDGTVVCDGYDIVPDGTRPTAEVVLAMSSIVRNLVN